MKTSSGIRITIMMFFEYFVWSAWYVTIGTFMGQTLKFDGTEIGLVYSALSIAAILSPVFVGKIADRYFASQNVLGVLHLLCAGLMYFASVQEDFLFMYIAILLYSMCYMPTIALTNAIAMSQMENPGKQFPYVRVFGTIGWIVMGLILGFLKIEAQSIPLLISAGVSLFFGLYCFTLPKLEPKKSDGTPGIIELLGLDALALMKDRSFAVLIICSLLVSIPLAFYYSFTNLFLNDINFENAAGKMTIGQISEVGFMLLMPLMFKRLGVKYMILIGMAAWIARYLFFGFGDTGALVSFLYAGIFLHGICYDFFFVTAQIYVDNKAPSNLKNSAQGLITMVTYGAGMFIGSWVAGVSVDLFTVDGAKLWKEIWMIPAAIAFIVLIIFSLFFQEDTRKGTIGADK